MHIFPNNLNEPSIMDEVSIHPISYLYILCNTYNGTKSVLVIIHVPVQNLF